ncbi:unnamed protein product, partial [Didymodactylos carnosus]
MLEPSGK